LPGLRGKLSRYGNSLKRVRQEFNLSTAANFRRATITWTIWSYDWSGFSRSSHNINV
jgi:hypothetical protein